MHHQVVYANCCEPSDQNDKNDNTSDIFASIWIHQSLSQFLLMCLKFNIEILSCDLLLHICAALVSNMFYKYSMIFLQLQSNCTLQNNGNIIICRHRQNQHDYKIQAIDKQNRMQQKYLHQHSLSSNLINNKLREEMYLKHLREVEKISNREADQLKKSLKQYNSIAQLHKRNKLKTNQFRLREYQRSIEEKNVKIHSKIKGLEGPSKNSKGNSLHITRDSQQCQKNNPSSPQKQKQKQTLTENEQAQAKPRSKGLKQSFHYRYRKRQQQLIEQENSKLMKAILTQKSTILPYINPNKIPAHRIRAASQLTKSRDSSPRNNDNDQ